MMIRYHRIANPGRMRGKTMKNGGSEANDHILATGGVLPFILGDGELKYDYTYITDHPPSSST
jgi:hypothetical protein